ncbi:Cenp-O kinetochore centromere component-domain-containing protein [Clohesyomyces aquaticus]|uniref:Cenp-O kinetochore centromere component-domain-containing protein n=1 Tax=Clohesyomyces aquaticus TaxID=1231657 RepID=A0A1Y1YKY9_9PLEO|nr:Cenp-O kinetochore centromere component-domain-containing protein [Clohesyomyces aquaticus]
MATTEALDNDIANLRARISHLQSHRANLASVLLSSPHIATRLQQRSVQSDPLRQKASGVVKRQSNRITENTYHACAGVTAYKVKDPDPNAIDHGNILGVRIEVAIGGKYIETYNVLLNRPHPEDTATFRICHHTIPPCIPLQPLANRFLPMTGNDATTMTEQNLEKFGKALRKELVSWHLRSAAVKSLRAEAGLSDKSSEEELEQEKEQYPVGRILNAFVSSDAEDSEEEEEARRKRQSGPMNITEIEPDHSVREIRVTWSNGHIGIVRVSKDGQVEKGVVRDAAGQRVSSLERKTVGRMEGLVHRLTGGSAL